MIMDNKKSFNLLLSQKVKKNYKFYPRYFLKMSKATQEKGQSNQKTENISKLLLGIKDQLKLELKSKKGKEIKQDFSRTVQRQSKINKKLKVIHNWLNNQKTTIDVSLYAAQKEQLHRVSQTLIFQNQNKWKANIIRRKTCSIATMKNESKNKKVQFHSSNSHRQHILNNRCNTQHFYTTKKYFPVPQNKDNRTKLIIQEIMTIQKANEVQHKQANNGNSLVLEIESAHINSRNKQIFTAEIIKGKFNSPKKSNFQQKMKPNLTSDKWEFEPW